MDCSLPGYIHGIFQARILEWVAISFSRGSSDPGIKPRSPALQADSLLTELDGRREVPTQIRLGRQPLCRLLKSVEFTNSEWEVDMYLAFSVLCLGFSQL